MEYLAPNDYIVAEKNGVCKNTLEVRVYRYGWTVKEAISRPVRQRRDLDVITAANLATLKENGIQATTFKQRLSQGWSEERASTEKIVRHNSKRKYSLEILAVAAENGIGYGTFITRIKNGWSEVEASTVPPLSKKEAAGLSKSKRWTEEERKKYYSDYAKEYYKSNKSYF